jgi:hypothetical protein
MPTFKFEKPVVGRGRPDHIDMELRLRGSGLVAEGVNSA